MENYRDDSKQAGVNCQPTCNDMNIGHPQDNRLGSFDVRNSTSMIVGGRVIIYNQAHLAYTHVKTWMPGKGNTYQRITRAPRRRFGHHFCTTYKSLNDIIHSDNANSPKSKRITINQGLRHVPLQHHCWPLGGDEQPPNKKSNRKPCKSQT